MITQLKLFNRFKGSDLINRVPDELWAEVHDLSHSQLLVLFFLTVQSFSIFGCKEYKQSDFGVDHLVMYIFSCVVGRGCLL